MKNIVLLAAVLSLPVQASCFVIGDLKGYSVRQNDKFIIDKDGISSQKFIVEINGEQSSVSPNNMNCFQAGSLTLICADIRDSGESTIETWAIYPTHKKAVYTKSINGFNKFNGANMFVGTIKGTCN